MLVSGVGNTSGLAPGQPGDSRAGQALAKEEFLKLLIAQLKYQNPMRPMDDRDFLVQLAQFNSLEQLMTLNQTMEAAIELQQLGQAAALLGKKVSARLEGRDNTVEGVVTAVKLNGGVAELVVGGEGVRLWEVMEITT